MFIIYDLNGTTAVLSAAPGVSQDRAMQDIPAGAVNVRVVYTAAEAAAAVTPSSPVVKIPSRDFINRFTPEEQHGFAAAVPSSPQVLLWLINLAAAGEVTLRGPGGLPHPDLKAQLDAAVAAGLLTAARAAEVLAP